MKYWEMYDFRIKQFWIICELWSMVEISRFHAPITHHSKVHKDGWAKYIPTFAFKVHIFWEGYKIFAKSPPFFDWYYIQSKKGGDFAKFLWPSQNIWTLIENFNNTRAYITSSQQTLEVKIFLSPIQAPLHRIDPSYKKTTWKGLSEISI